MKLLLVAAAAAAVLAALAGVASAAPSDTPPSVSSNWAGYAVADPATIAGQASTQPLTFTSVTGTWVQPKATCAAGSQAYSAFWVGLGGYSSTSLGLEQIGTESDCSATGQPSYFAWYELVPQTAVPLRLKIMPGDTITTSVNVSGTDVLVQVKDRTRKTSVTKHLEMANPDLTSAEWIAEAPSQCDAAHCHVLPLADFGNVSFSRIATIGNGHGGTVTDPAWASASIELVPDSSRSFFGTPNDDSTAGATPGAASPDGRTFSVAWLPDASSGSATPNG